MAITITNVAGTQDLKIVSGYKPTVEYAGNVTYGGDSSQGTYWIRLAYTGADYFIGQETFANNTPTVNGVVCTGLTLFLAEMAAAKATALAAGAGSATGETDTTEMTPQIALSFQDDVNPKRASTATDGGFGSVTRTGGYAILNSGGDAGGYAALASVDTITIQPGQTIEARFCCNFQNQDAGSDCLIGLENGTLGANPMTGDGIYLGYRGTDFGLFVKKNGTFTAYLRSAWNIDSAFGTGLLPEIAPDKFNEYRLQVSMTGGILLSIADSSGVFRNAHRIEYDNTATAPFVLNWGFRLAATVDNRTGTATSETTLNIISMAAFIHGARPEIGKRTAVQVIKTGIAPATETVVVNIKNNPIFSGDKNTRRARISSIAGGVTVSAGISNGPFSIAVYKSTTTPTAPAWAAISATTSILDKDTAGTLSATAADLIGGTGTGDLGGFTWAPDSPEYLQAGEYLTVTGYTVAGTAAVILTINFVEE